MVLYGNPDFYVDIEARRALQAGTDTCVRETGGMVSQQDRRPRLTPGRNERPFRSTVLARLSSAQLTCHLAACRRAPPGLLVRSLELVFGELAQTANSVSMKRPNRSREQTSASWARDAYQFIVAARGQLSSVPQPQL